MFKGKKMNEIAIIVIVVLLLLIIVGIVVSINRPREIAMDQIEMLEAPVKQNEIANEGAKQITDTMNYVENQVIAVANSKSEAKKIAKAIGGELLSYDNQVATIQIGITVEEMMQMLEEDPTLPKVYPNYQNYSN